VKKIFSLWMVFTVLLGGCAANSPVQPPTVQTTSVLPAGQPAEKIKVYAPASTSSIPVILAASKMPDVNLTLYSNQAQANTLFLRGDVDVLVTGLSVGLDMYKNSTPVQIVNSYVSGLSYLVTNGHKVNSIADLKGQQIYLPFKGSPIEEVTAYFAQQAGLKWPDDFKPVYMPFDSSVELLKQGKAGAVVLPEPYVTLLENQPGIFISLSYYDEWEKSHPKDDGYPQVGSLVKAEWAQNHAAQITRFNDALSAALSAVKQDPASAVDAAKTHYKISADLLLKSLNRTRYHMLTGDEMRQSISTYYDVVAKPLNENDAKFFYIAAK